MKLLISKVFVLSLALSQAQAATEIKGKSQIREVTVFKDRAFVQRRQSADFNRPDGYMLYFSEVSPLADTESLKATVSDSAAVQIMGIRNLPHYRLKYRDQNLQNLKDEIRASQERLEKMREDVGILLRDNNGLQSLSEHYKKSFSVNLHGNRWKRLEFGQFLDFLRQRSDSMRGKWQSIFLSFQKELKVLERLHNRELELSSPSQQDTLTIVVDLLVKKPVKNLSVDIHYLVSHVGWQPSYDLRVDSGQRTASLEQFALIRQSSGEDWNNVKMVLSNSRSELRPQIPQISSYVLNYQEVDKVKTSVSGKQDQASHLSIPMAGGIESSLDEGLAMNFSVPGLHTLRNGMKQSKVSIQKQTTSYAEHLEVVAEQYPKVYRRGTLDNPFKDQLVGGPLHVYYDGLFMQQSWMDTVAQGQPIEINAGIDHNVTVSYGANHSGQKPGILSKKKHFIRKSFTSLTNWDAKSKKIRILDRVPVSEIKEVEISTRDSTPGFGKLEQHPGWIYWEATLASRRQETFELKLDISVPDEFNFNW